MKKRITGLLPAMYISFCASLTLFKKSNTFNTNLAPIDATYLKAQGILFCHRWIGKFNLVLCVFLKKLNFHIACSRNRWTESGSVLRCPVFRSTDEAKDTSDVISQFRISVPLCLTAGGIIRFGQ